MVKGALLKIVILMYMTSMYSKVSSQNSTIENSGDVLQYVLPATAGISTLFYQGGDKPGVQFAKAFGGAMLITHGVKRILNKPRPNGGDYAFPSGHTTAAFVSAGFIHKRYGWQWGLPAYVASAYVGWTRVDAGRHDWWDVIAGAGIGVVSGHFFGRRFENQDQKMGVMLGLNTISIQLQF